MEVLLLHWCQRSHTHADSRPWTSSERMMCVTTSTKMKKADRNGPAFQVWFVDRVDQPLHISQSGPFSMEQAATCSSWVISVTSLAASVGCSLYFLSTVNLMASVAAFVRR